MEWVYTSDREEEEDVLYEGDGQLAPRKGDGGDAGFDGIPETDESQEFFGDDVEDVRLSPAEAFAKLSTLILGHGANGETLASGVVQGNGQKLCARNTTIAESREDRIRRVRDEIEDLTGNPVEDLAGDEPNIFAAFREQLNAIEQYTSVPTLHRSGTRVQFVKTGKGQRAEPRDTQLGLGSAEHSPAIADESQRAEGGDGVTVNVYAPTLGAVLNLEERVAALERVVGSSIHVEAQGTNVCTLMDEVRTKLDLVADVKQGERLRRDAEQVSAVLNATCASQDLAEPLRLGRVLNRMAEWEHIAAALPTVVGRLRSLKRLHDEAGAFVSTVHELGAKYEAVLETSRENSVLVSTVRDNLDNNLTTVQENLTLLESRLEALSNPT